MSAASALYALPGAVCTVCVSEVPSAFEACEWGLVAGGDSFLNIGQYAMLSIGSQQQVATYHLVKQHFCFAGLRLKMQLLGLCIICSKPMQTLF